jgi:hypothetical protein
MNGSGWAYAIASAIAVGGLVIAIAAISGRSQRPTMATVEGRPVAASHLKEVGHEP